MHWSRNASASWKKMLDEKTMHDMLVADLVWNHKGGDKKELGRGYDIKSCKTM